MHGTQDNDLPKPQFRPHPLRGKIPEMRQHDYDDMRCSIKRNGQRLPILKKGELIVDGWSRYQACLALGIPPLFNEINISDEDISDFASDLNFHRRHLAAENLLAALYSLSERAKRSLPE